MEAFILVLFLGGILVGVLGYQASAARRRVKALAKLERRTELLSSLLYGEFVSASDLANWWALNTQALRESEMTWDEAQMMAKDCPGELHAALRFFRDPEEARKSYNEQHVRDRLLEESSWFDHLEAHPLTQAQRLAIVRNEDNNLVNAGAGSGKTSVVVARVGYLLRRGLCKPGEILVLAFNKSAVEELVERLREMGSAGVKVTTFHALGYSVIGEVEGVMPPISPLTNKSDFEQFIQRQVAEAISDPAMFAKFERLLTGLLEGTVDETKYKNKHERYQKEKALGLRSLDGTLLKSRQEVAIANWCTLNGIEWEYERAYPFEHGGGHRHYTPDFYLPEADAYLEHFGVDRKGNTAPDIDAVAYREKMVWARRVHLTNGTTLVETYSWMFQENRIERELQKIAQQLGLRQSPISEEKVAELLRDRRSSVTSLATTLGQFINLARSNNHRLEEISRRAKTERERVFVQFTWRIMERYEAELRTTQRIDFHEMINRATDYVVRNSYSSPFQHIVVDEFQDISLGRMALIKALRGQRTCSRVFAVGDDWQSIYQFTGSDVGLITNFSHHLGESLITPLDRTFRFHQEAVALSSEFIQRNPAQLRKVVKSQKGKAGRPQVTVCFYNSRFGGEEAHVAQCSALEQVIAEICENGDAQSILVLGRYNFSLPQGATVFFDELREQGFEVKFETVHRAKGAESDVVIVLGMENSEYGFPSSVSDDPVLRLVKVDDKAFANAEERRLFYVALTRSRGRTFLLAPSESPSEFIEELREIQGGRLVSILGEEKRLLTCNVCQGHTVRKISGQYRDFWGCCSFPVCEGKLESCRECEDGAMEPQIHEGLIVAYRCSECGMELPPCPECRVGILLRREGRYGQFQGCSKWRADGDGCGFTQGL